VRGWLVQGALASTGLNDIERKIWEPIILRVAAEMQLRCYLSVFAIAQQSEKLMILALVRTMVPITGSCE
jgi:hypothetical protein